MLKKKESSRWASSAFSFNKNLLSDFGWALRRASKLEEEEIYFLHFWTWQGEYLREKKKKKAIKESDGEIMWNANKQVGEVSRETMGSAARL